MRVKSTYAPIKGATCGGLVFATVVLLLVIVFAVSSAIAQQQAIVFQRAYVRQFVVTNCTNANPPVVTIATPTATNALTWVPLDAGSLVTITGVAGNTACNVTDNAINVLTAVTFELTGAVGNAAYTVGGIGVTDTISTAATASIPMPNVGQSGHLVSVEFPTAVATVTPIQVRLEAADTCPDPPFCGLGNWRPIQGDTLEVVSVGGTFYQFNIANGVWRALRINSVLGTPANLPMRVDYTGTPSPLGPLILLGDRFEILSPFNSGQSAYEFVAGSCQAGTAGLAFNGPAPLPEATCITGANETLAVAAFDTTTTECVEDSFFLPTIGTPNALQLNVLWQASNVGTVQWSTQTACIGAGQQLGSVAFSAANNVTGTAAVANQLINTAFPVITTGCLAESFLFYKFCRTGATGTLAVDALMKSLSFVPAQ